MAEKQFARMLCKRQTDAERFLWFRLRSHRFGGYKFRRQQALDRYIVDFVCFEPKLIIELDGGQHASQYEYDVERLKLLQRLGFKILRFWNDQILNETDSVLEVILLELSRSPLPQGEG